jgi:enoyl-CoA hydratase
VGSCPVPLIGAINGAAFGAGMVFASLCDTRIAADTARFALSEINVGRCGGAARAGRLISQGMVRRMFFTGEPIDAAEALRIGLVEAVVPSVELAVAAADLAHRIAGKSPLACALASSRSTRSKGCRSRRATQSSSPLAPNLYKPATRAKR